MDKGCDTDRRFIRREAVDGAQVVGATFCRAEAVSSRIVDKHSRETTKTYLSVPGEHPSRVEKLVLVLLLDRASGRKADAPE